MIEIQHGVVKDPTVVNKYYYVDSSILGYIENYQTLLLVENHDTVYPFTTKDGEKPEIGDFIDGGVLVKRTQPKVNNDWSKWKDKDL